ncbi:hypothetical protein VIBRN418_03716 [Vibrio sp. N418]|nr:hypothetical protein VIBRN418_03716 [Vibrio sp. N418]
MKTIFVSFFHFDLIQQQKSIVLLGFFNIKKKPAFVRWLMLFKAICLIFV